MHNLIASPFLGDYLLLRPGDSRGVKISPDRYKELCNSQVMPSWLADVGGVDQS